MLCACARDAENQIFPLAFGTGDSENNDSCDYFFKMLRESYSEREDMWIVSDRHPSIHKGVEKWFPKALGYCNFHFIKNLKNNFLSIAKALAENFSRSWKAYDKQVFEYNL